MAPERILRDRETYSIQSDIWSLGLTLLECGLGNYPLPCDKSVFSQLAAIMRGDVLSLPFSFSQECHNFLDITLQFDPKKRGDYHQLSQHPWIQSWQYQNVDMEQWVSNALEYNHLV
jgi:mitogen-activated protein kinase kinase